MTQPGQYPDAPRSGPVPAAAFGPAHAAGGRSTAARFGGAAAALLGTVAASALLGLLAGLLWSAIAPRALLIVQSRGVAYVVNAETGAFIAAEGWFCLLTAAAGLLCGVAGYFLVVRRYGAVAVSGLVLGGVAAALLAMWAGQQQGLAGFRAQLAASPAGTQLHEPLALAGHGPLAFWALFAALTVGTIELVSQSAERKRAELAVQTPPPPPRPTEGGTGLGAAET
ncbi:MAG TPA: hypothetical protein VGI74_17370 [Streptosporangiaceae bacterium]